MLLLVSVASILIHEGAHALTSAIFGYAPDEVEITPLGALMRLENDNVLPAWKQALVLLAGPLTSLGLCWGSMIMTRAGYLLVDLGRLVFVANALIVVLNLLPALPLDGGRLLSLILSTALPSGLTGRIMRVMGTFMGIALIGMDIYLCLHTGTWNFSMCFAGCMLLYAAVTCTRTMAMAELRALLDRKIMLETHDALRCEVVAVKKDIPCRQALKKLSPHRYTIFLLLEPGTLKADGWVGERTLVDAYMQNPGGRCSEALITSKDKSLE